ncbi:MAG: hypothetical protein H6734_10170 [Alphaproteobacteria bacterium]|nr:hypothetical protein [Alphaproteobacteria bacterium]
MRPPALVVLNPGAHGGRGRERFERVRYALEAVCTPTVVTLGPDWSPVREAIASGTRMFVAAGGDGTVNALVNALDRERGDVPLEDLVLGAVGLGSSNDFHKPVRRAVDGIPVRIDAGEAVLRDVIACTWDDGESLAMVSGSVGVTAAANAFFNDGDAVLRALKSRSTLAAILWSALRTLARHRGLHGRVDLPGLEGVPLCIDNLSVLETEWLSGTFRYDTPVDPTDGHLQVDLLEGRGRLGTLVALVALARGRFSGRPGTHCARVRSVTVELDAPAHLELDGELHRARTVRFDVLPRRIRTCP